jgi:hypothetical protein
MNHDEIRRTVRKLCEGFPGPYWRDCDRERRYPVEFVDALTQSGFLAALIPLNSVVRNCRFLPPPRSSRKFKQRAAIARVATRRCM